MEVPSTAEAKDELPVVLNDVSSTQSAAVLLPVDDLEALEGTIFWLEREIARLRSGERLMDGPDISEEEMAVLMKRRRREAGSV